MERGAAAAPEGKGPALSEPAPAGEEPSPAGSVDAESPRPRLDYIHSFRALAIVAVVATHVVPRPPAGTSAGIQVAKALIENATVSFLFISGFLFQHLSGTFQYGNYLKGKLQRVILPYLVISIPTFLLWRPWMKALEAGDLAAVSRMTAAGLLTGAHNPAPLWFVPLIAVLYLAAPLLLYVDRRPWMYVLLPPLIVAAMFCHRPATLTHLGHALAYFTPAYLAGMFASRYRERLLSLADHGFEALAVACIALLGVDFMAFGARGAIFSTLPFSTENGLIDLDLPLKLVLTVLAIAFLRRQDPAFHRPFDYLAGASFGIFFLHSFARDAFRKLAAGLLGPGFFTGWSSLFLFTPIVVAMSLAAVWVVRFVIGKRSRFVIGC